MTVKSETPPEKIIARVAAGAALTVAAGHASASLDKLATWLLAAFGAGLALTLSHLKDVLDFIPASCVASAAYSFLFASVLCLAQRYVAMIIGCGASAAKEGREIGGKFNNMDVQEFIAQMKANTPCMLRPMASWTP